MLESKTQISPPSLEDRPVEILLVEDSPTDALITGEAFKKSKSLGKLHIVETGEDAMAFLRAEGKFGDAPRPGLVLMDLNLPGISGVEVIRMIKDDSDLKTIPVVALTTSKSAEDIASCYRSGVNSYIAKPSSFDRFAEVLKAVEAFWFSVVVLPRAT